MKAWHFTGETLRDGSPVPPIGETLRHEGRLMLCASGLHASRDIIDALKFAPGAMLHRVDCGGVIVHRPDKLCCSERTIRWSIDATDALRRFARLCALDVIHLWSAPEVVVRYLRTGGESIRDAAWAAARDAAGAAVWAAAWDAAGAAAWDAAGAAARAAERKRQSRRLVRMVTAARAALGRES